MQYCEKCQFSDDLENMYQCEYCKKSIHLNCADFFDCKNIQTSIKTLSSWYCQDCLPFHNYYNIKEPIHKPNLDLNDISKIAGLAISGLLNDCKNSNEILKIIYGDNYKNLIEYYKYLGYLDSINK